MSDNKSSPISQRGFTLVEVTVAIAVAAAIGVVFLSVVTSFMITINRTNQTVEMTLSAQNLMRNTVENIRYGDGVRQTNTIADANAPAGGWNTSNSIFVIILAVPAVDATNSFIINPATGSPYMNELVYYKKDSNLMRRTLAHPGATGNKTVTSCPPELATATCPSDNTLSEYVTAMDFILYDQDGTLTTDSQIARSVRINITMTRGSSTTPITVENSIRVTLRNRF